MNNQFLYRQDTFGDTDDMFITDLELDPTLEQNNYHFHLTPTAVEKV
jgi:hypothetical protein